MLPSKTPGPDRRRPPKLFVIIESPPHFRYLDSAVRELCRRGNRVVLACRRYKTGKMFATRLDAPFEACVAEFKECSTDRIQDAAAYRPEAVTLAREVMHYAIAHRPNHPIPMGRSAIWHRLRRPCAGFVRLPALRGLLSSNLGLALWRRVERSFRPAPAVLGQLRTHAPDVIVACPGTNAYQAEYLRAAGALGIPTVAWVHNYDYLATQGTYLLLPDRVIVWNSLVAHTAIRVHDVPADRVRAVGAPQLDFFFDTPPWSDRRRFCAHAGIDPERAYVAFLTGGLADPQQEIDFVRTLAAGMAADPRTSGLLLLVRPHPYYAQRWSQVKDPGIKLWPPSGETPDMPEGRLNFRNTLHHAVAVVGMRTLGLVEAAVADRPCITLIGGPYPDTPEMRSYFFSQGFAEITGSLAEMVERIACVSAGADPQKAQRRRFVERCVRPHGLERPAACAAADAIEEMIPTAAVDARRPAG